MPDLHRVQAEVGNPHTIISSCNSTESVSAKLTADHAEKMDLLNARIVIDQRPNALALTALSGLLAEVGNPRIHRDYVNETAVYANISGVAIACKN